MNVVLPLMRRLAGFALVIVPVFILLLAMNGSRADNRSDLDDRSWRMNGLAERGHILPADSQFWQTIGGNDVVPAGSNLELPEGGGIMNPDIGAIRPIRWRGLNSRRSMKLRRFTNSTAVCAIISIRVRKVYFKC
jgi:hypothetical protein